MLPQVFQALFNNVAVNAIVQNRIYRHDSAPQGGLKPYITWGLISGVPENTLSELPKIDRLPIQVDCYHQTDAGIVELAQAVRDAIEPLAHMTNIPINTREEDTKLYRITLEFEWWLYR
jgi:hypothetical protein